MGCLWCSYSRPKELQDKFFPDFEKTLPRMDGKAVAITGCTSGTGLVCAQTCARLGARVYLLNRPSERSAKALKDVQSCVGDASKVVDVPVDLQSFDSVRKAVDQLKASELGSQGLDVLVNNAAVMGVKAEPTVDGFDVQMQTNVLSHFLLTQGLMPLLDRAADLRGDARIVNHSSLARHQGRQAGLQAKYFGRDLAQQGGDGMSGRYARYGQSKYANIVFTEALADRLERRDAKSKVIAVSAHPGVAATNLQVTAHNDGGLPGFIARYLVRQSAADGAMGIIRGACGADVRMREFFGPVKDGWNGRAESLPLENSPEKDRETLWSECEKACGVSFAL